MAINCETDPEKELVAKFVCTESEMETQNRSNMLASSSNVKKQSSGCNSCTSCTTKIIMIIWLIIQIVFIGVISYFHVKCCPTISNQHTTVSEEVKHCEVGETKPALMLYMDRDHLKNSKSSIYTVNWTIGKHGFTQGNISFNGSHIYINQSGTYRISISLQIINNSRKNSTGNLCNLVLHSSKDEHIIRQKYSILESSNKDNSLAMSLNMGLKLEAGQYLYVSVSPQKYLSTDENVSTLFIHSI